MTQAERSEYATVVWETFLAHSKSERLTISPAEYAILSRWIEEVPLRIVLRAFRDTQGRGKSLRYYQEPVRAAYASWRAAVPL